MQATFPFGRKILCDGHVIDKGGDIAKLLKINSFLCDGYVTIHAKRLFDGYLTISYTQWVKALFISMFLFDGYLLKE